MVAAGQSACWRQYLEAVASIAYAGPTAAGPAGAVQPSHVDCFATQHTRGMKHDRRQRSSVAVHLVALCLLLEHDVGGSGLMGYRQRTSKSMLPALGVADWPLLSAPDDYGAVTVASIHDAPVAEREDVLAQWPGAVWEAWREHHDTVRGWTGILLRGPR